jgi:hypothetical protein
MSEPTSKRARTDAPVDNPYLAHLNEPHKRMTGGANGGSAPFDGWIPRKINGKQVEDAMVSQLFHLTLVETERGEKKDQLDSRLRLSARARKINRDADLTAHDVGWRSQPIHPSTSFEEILRHLRSSQKAPSSPADERVPHHVQRKSIRSIVRRNRFRKDYTVS